MHIHHLSSGQFAQALKRGFRYQLGPFTVELRSNLSQIAELVYRLYGDCEATPAAPIADFHIRLERPGGLRRWYRPQVRFLRDGESPFAPYPAESAFPLLEWGLNWCVATTSHQYLMLHAAVVEKNGCGILLPAWPGSGKSTLCAALAYRDWRMLSDEFGLVRLEEDQYIPFPRCIPLKNESIEVFRRFAPEALMGPVFPKTRKGDVAHVKPPQDSVVRVHETARASLVVFPSYTPQAKASLRHLPKPRAFMKLADNSFNYQLLGAAGFRTVRAILRASDCYLLRYGDLQEAIDTLHRLVS
jgi:HprK-related kinase A